MMGDGHQRLRLSMLLGLLFVLAGCAAPGPLPDPPDPEAIARETEHQRQLSLMHRHQEADRLVRIAQPLLEVALALCADQQRTSYGLRLHNLSSYPPDMRDAARALYGLDQRIRLRPPLPSSPAARAGLRQGDVVVRIQGRLVEGRSPGALARDLRDSTGPIEVVVQRDDLLVRVRLAPVRQCDWPLVLSNSSAINAYADGKQIRITRAMLRYAREDVELAVVVAHELAHNGLNHMDKQLRNLLLGALLDVLALTQGFPSPGIGATLTAQYQTLNWELEADLQALILLQRLGYPLADAVEFWRRLGTDFPAAIRHSRGLSHPGTAERYLRMKAAARALSGADRY
jgi:Zn-dependent protease with chaperone function